MENRTCNFCDGSGRFETSRDVRKIASNVRAFREETFTVWRCPSCRSLHSLESADMSKYYRQYPIHGQKEDFFTRRLFATRLRQLKRAGMERRHAILDYGCGNGGFVRFLQRQGFARSVGYDPYAKEHADDSVLSRRYDFVLCQDVIEHVENPDALLDSVMALVRPGGIAALGVPDAERLDLGNPYDQAGRLHQPYHRHIPSAAQLRRRIESRKWRVVKSIRRWYADTRFPFLNSVFLFRYIRTMEGALDAAFEPIRFGTILRSPLLMLAGLFGGFFAPGKDMLILATRVAEEKSKLPSALPDLTKHAA